MSLYICVCVHARVYAWLQWLCVCVNVQAWLDDCAVVVTECVHILDFCVWMCCNFVLVCARANIGVLAFVCLMRLCAPTAPAAVKPGWPRAAKCMEKRRVDEQKEQCTWASWLYVPAITNSLDSSMTELLLLQLCWQEVTAKYAEDNIAVTV